MQTYKSWSNLNRQLTEFLCDNFRGRITYFLTSYSAVHNAYGRAAILLDGKELVRFSWDQAYQQERDVSLLISSGDQPTSPEELLAKLKPDWDAHCTYSQTDFLDAALKFRNMDIQEALGADNCIIKILAILDRRVGKRTLLQIKENGEYQQYPDWVRQFYRLRLNSI